MKLIASKTEADLRVELLESSRALFNYSAQIN
jgi:hypothetical protein